MILATQIVHKIGLVQILHVNYTLSSYLKKNNFRLNLKRFLSLFFCSEKKNQKLTI